MASMTKREKELAQKLETARSALKIIHTWASFDGHEMSSGKKIFDAGDVMDLIKRTLDKTVKGEE